jgi:N-acetylglucosamine-6-phosphate deacetylase
VSDREAGIPPSSERDPASKVLSCARVLNGEGGISASPAWIAIEDGRIVASGAGTPPGDAVDLGDAWVAPGFIDAQVNGTGAVDFASATVEQIVAAVDTLVASGTTGLLPTLCSAPLDAYAAMLERLEAVRTQRPDAVIGVHLEGPFLGGAPGAHPVELVRGVDLDWLRELCDRHGDLIRFVTLAPEADPNGAAIELLTERGILVALGHSTVDFDGAKRAVDAGARVATHLFNGMGPLHHRAPGLAGTALTDERLVPSLIADFVHVHPAMVQLALAARADAVLVSDAVRETDTTLADGTLAGSKITMADAVCNVGSLGFAPARAIRYATGNPARVLGLSDRGRIAPGTRADLVALDPETLAVRSVWSAGRPVAKG